MKVQRIESFTPFKSKKGTDIGASKGAVGSGKWSPLIIGKLHTKNESPN